MDKQIASSDQWAIDSAVRTEGIFAQQYLLPWAQSLSRNVQGTPRTILDLAGGAGKESEALKKAGFSPLLIDLSSHLLSATEITKKVLADIHKLPIAENSVNGVLIKDAWIFLDQESRIKVLGEMRRVLSAGGSILILSQKGDKARLRYIPSGSQLPQIETYDTDEQMMSDIENGLIDSTKIISTEYISTVDDTIHLAQELGWSVAVIEDYKFDHPLAKQNKWVNKSGFIIKLTKLQ